MARSLGQEDAGGALSPLSTSGLREEVFRPPYIPARCNSAPARWLGFPDVLGNQLRFQQSCRHTSRARKSVPGPSETFLGPSKRVRGASSFGTLVRARTRHGVNTLVRGLSRSTVDYRHPAGRASASADRYRRLSTPWPGRDEIASGAAQRCPPPPPPPP
jgi:hypothetical protein